MEIATNLANLINYETEKMLINVAFDLGLYILSCSLLKFLLLYNMLGFGCVTCIDFPYLTPFSTMN